MFPHVLREGQFTGVVGSRNEPWEAVINGVHMEYENKVAGRVEEVKFVHMEYKNNSARSVEEVKFVHTEN